MNILFLTLNIFDSLDENTIYTDLLRKFVEHGDSVYVITPLERRHNKKSYIIREDNVEILKLRIGNIFHTNIIEKGISTVLIGSQYKSALRHYWSDVKFDLVLYSTPPITFVSAIEYVKKRDCAYTYLMLKDIFPQNAVDIGMMTKSGVKGLIYSFFRKKEKGIYKLSDYIGCMSEANVSFVLNHNDYIEQDKVGICPNCVDTKKDIEIKATRNEIREKYGIPLDKKVFVYGGNLGKPQGIDYLIECLKSQKNNDSVFFLIIGDGTEYNKLLEYSQTSNQSNFKLIKRVPKEEYDTIISSCDVGMIFLDYRFTIPNFPSRILGYMQAKLPIIACTDPNTDVGTVISNGGFGWACMSNDVNSFQRILAEIEGVDTKAIGEIGYKFLIQNYDSEIAYKLIKSKYENR